MLYQAQKAVAKSLENGWFRKYASTFPEEITQKSNYYLNPISAKPITITTEKTVSDFCKKATISRINVYVIYHLLYKVLYVEFTTLEKVTTRESA